MAIILNGKSIELPEEIQSISELLRYYNLENRIVVVEVNQEITYKEQYDSTILSDKDRIEIIHFVGGG